jgi:putative ABC transport system substrate-binding protein
MIDPLAAALREQTVALAAAYRLPVIYAFREDVVAGGLVSYGTSLPDQYRQAATFVHKIFTGAKPADIPVEQPTKFDLVINLKTANALGLQVPPTLLARADEVIE